MNIREAHARAVHNIERLEKDIEALAVVADANVENEKAITCLSDIEMRLKMDLDLWRHVKSLAMCRIVQDRIP